MSRWFRVYDDLVDDPKVQRLPAELFKILINIWCIASQNGGVLPPPLDIAFKLRIKPDKLDKLMVDLCTAGLLDEDETGTQPHNWQKRQFKSDASNERVKRFRERYKGVTGNADVTLHETTCNAAVTLHVTPPETETETETEREAEREQIPRKSAEVPKRSSRGKASRLSAEWKPSLADLEFAAKQNLPAAATETEITKFKNYWLAKSGKDAAKLDWSRTWQNWILNAKQYQSTNRTSPTSSVIL